MPKYDFDVPNYLEIKVGSATDVVVKLMDYYSGLCVRYVYIQGGTRYKIENIPESKYFLKIAYGKTWMQKVEHFHCIGKFKQNPIYEKGEDILDFKVVKTYAGESYSTYELELDVYVTNPQDVYDSKNISENEFNK